MSDKYAEIRAALDGVDFWENSGGEECFSVEVSSWDDAANPIAIRALLAERDAQAAEIATLRNALRKSAAIEADRQRRGEPVFTLHVIGALQQWVPTPAAFGLKDGNYNLYLSPQPAEPDNDQRQNSRQIIHETIHAEPVVVDHGETRMDADVPAKYGSVSGKVVDHGSEPVTTRAEDELFYKLGCFVDHATGGPLEQVGLVPRSAKTGS